MDLEELDRKIRRNVSPSIQIDLEKQELVYVAMIFDEKNKTDYDLLYIPYTLLDLNKNNNLEYLIDSVENEEYEQILEKFFDKITEFYKEKKKEYGRDVK